MWRDEDLSTYAEESNYIGLRLAIAFVGMISFAIFPRSAWWLLAAFMTLYGLASAFWMIMLLYSSSDSRTADQPERIEGRDGPAVRPILYNSGRSLMMMDGGRIKDTESDNNSQQGE